MATILGVLLALIRSHGAELGRHGRAMALYATLIGMLALVAAVYLVILATYLLALAVGTGWALAAVAGLALAGCLVLFLALRAEARRLVAAHRAHLEEERLVLRAAGVEAVAAGKLGGSIAAVSASLAAVLVLVLRRFGGEAGAAGDPRPGEAPAAGDPATHRGAGAAGSSKPGM